MNYRTAGLLPFSLALLTLAIPAQVADVPGDYGDLQTAIDSSAAGSVLVVHGGTWQAIRIDKPLTIIGEPMTTIEGRLVGTNPNDSHYEPPIMLAGPGSGAVVLSNVRTGGEVPGNVIGQATPGIMGGGFSELHVYDSVIEAPVWVNVIGGLGVGEPAVQVSVPFMTFQRCAIRAADNVNDPISPTNNAWPGSAGIQAPNATVVVGDSTVEGGDSGVFGYPVFTSCGDIDCPGGEGGHGVRSRFLYVAGSSLIPGLGPVWLDWQGFLCCTGMDGQPFVGNTVEVRPGHIELLGALEGGRSFTLDLTAPGPTVALLTSVGLRPPVSAFMAGPLFLEADYVLLGMFTSPGPVVLSIPLQAGLLGRLVAFQSLDPSAGLSHPVASVVRIPRLTGQGAPGDTVSGTAR